MLCYVVFLKTLHGKQKLTAAILRRILIYPLYIYMNVFYVFVVLRGPVYEGGVRSQVSRMEG